KTEGGCTGSGGERAIPFPSFRPSVAVSDSLAHPPRRHARRAPHRRPETHPRPRLLDRARDRRPLGWGCEAHDARHARGARTAPAPSAAALSYGRRVSRGPGGGGEIGRAHV